jgi:hypothetical protein
MTVKPVVNKATNDQYIKQYVLDDTNYDVRTDGTIWTRYSKNGAGLIPNYNWRQTGLTISNSKGYFRLELTIDSNRVRINVARIIYLKFNGPLHEDLVINHIDENKLNNNPSNLELVTIQQNNVHNRRTEDFRTRNSVNHIFDMTKARECRRLRSLGKTYKELMVIFQASRSCISNLVKNKIWKEPTAA